MEPWEKLIRALAEIWAEEDIKAGYYKEASIELDKGEGEDHGIQEQSVG